MFLKLDDRSQVQVYTEEADACHSCPNASECPLILMLYNELAILKYESINVEECVFSKVTLSEQEDKLNETESIKMPEQET